MSHLRPEQLFLNKLRTSDTRDGCPTRRETVSAAARFLGISRRTVQRHTKSFPFLKDDEGLVIFDYLSEHLDNNLETRGCKLRTKRPQKLIRFLTKEGKVDKAPKAEYDFIKALDKIHRIVRTLSVDNQLFAAKHFATLLSPDAQAAIRFEAQANTGTRESS